MGFKIDIESKEISEVISEYNFLNLSKIELNKILKLTLSELSINKDQDNINILSIIELFQAKLDKIVENNLENANNVILLYDNFIKCVFVKSKDTTIIKKNLNELCNFANTYNFAFDETIISKLMNTSKIFKEQLNLFFKVNKDLFVKGDFSKINDDEYIINLIEIYCSVNNINIDYSFSYDDYDYFLSKNNSTIMYYSKYLDNPVLSATEEAELFNKYKNGDKEAKNKIVEHNFKLVLFVIKNTKSGNIVFDDLFQEGLTALIKAVEYFNVNNNGKFSTYAVTAIRFALFRYIQNHTFNIRIPVYLHSNMFLCNNVRNEYIEKYGEEPSIEYIAEETNLSFETVKNILSIDTTVNSLDVKLADDNNSTMQDIIEDKSSNFNGELHDSFFIQDDINLLLDSVNLNEKEKNILTLRYGLNGKEALSLEEIGKIYGCTFEAIRLLENKALNKLLFSKRIKDYADYMDDVDKALENLNLKKNNYWNYKPETNLNMKLGLYYSRTSR